uniref:GpcrRhopsn4 domain-containing protein n=1 Tax=Caenorhabditis japonica TaxID=281687 RepID=A0A8R1HPZ3_CAEJA
MMTIWVLSKLLLFLGLHFVNAAHITGSWNPSEEKVLVVTKFGYQQTKSNSEKDHRGFLYGHFLPQTTFNYSNPVLLAIVSSENINIFRKNSDYGMSCGSMLHNLTRKGFEPRCFPNGTSDVFRWIPCPEGHLCKGEDNASNVVPGYQMTMQIQEPYNPEHWFVLLIACNLDSNCEWKDSSPNVPINYDMWLTNGRPNSAAVSFFTFNFSFDEQNTVQLFLLTTVTYAVLSIIQSGANYKNRQIPPRSNLLSRIITMKLVGYSLQCFNVMLFAYDGQGFFLARIAGEVLRNTSIQVHCLLLILLAKGWDISYPGTEFPKKCLYMWGFLAGLDTILFFYNCTFVYDVLHDVDIYSAWPGHGMILIRIIYAIWFLIEIRKLIDSEQNRQKAEFLAHLGAGFLVWFVSLPMIGIVASFVSQLWRFSLILALTTFSNFVALSCLVHQFWPKSSYRKFFADYTKWVSLFFCLKIY